MQILKRILFVGVFLTVWIGSIFLYAMNASGTAKESVLLIISIFWVIVFSILAWRVFGKKPVDPDAAAAAAIAQIVGADGFEDVDVDE